LHIAVASHSGHFRSALKTFGSVSGDGFISGTLGKKMNLEVKSTKGEDGERSYSVKA